MINKSARSENARTQRLLREDEAGLPREGFPRPGPSEDPARLAEQERYYEYLSQAGFDNPRMLGMVREDIPCRLRVSQGAGSFNSGLTETCTSQPQEPGWVIQSATPEVIENKHDRGRYSFDVIAEGGEFNKTVKEIGDTFKLAIDLAASKGDIEVKRKIEIEHQRHLERVVHIGATRNTVHLSVTANGGLFRKSVIEVALRVKLLKVR